MSSEVQVPAPGRAARAGHAGLRPLENGAHLVFLVLLIVGALRAGQEGTTLAPLIGLVLLTLGWYLAGWWLARRWRGVPWVLGLAGCAVALVLLSPSFLWVAFPIWLLLGHLLPLWPAVLTVGVTLLVGLWALTDGFTQTTPAVIIGPVTGAVIALGIARAQVRLAREAETRRQLIERWQTAQAEAAELQEELVRAQREAGAQEERTRLSRDIHDTLAQGFSSIVLLARAGQRGDLAAEMPAALARIEETAEEGLAQSRAVVAALAPPELSSGLTAALQRIAERLTQETGIEAQVRSEPVSMSRQAEVALLRAAQSALANVRRHAQASRVVVTLSGGGDQVRLDVVDDGLGFEPSTLAGPSLTGGYGLVAMRARLTELGGGLEVESAPGEGTALSAWVPTGWREGS